MNDTMGEFLQTPLAQSIIAVAALAILVMFAYYIVLRFRHPPDQRPPSASELLSNFRQLHEEGDIDEKEFRSIKSIMGERLQQELEVSSGDNQPDNQPGKNPSPEGVLENKEKNPKQNKKE